MQRCYLIQEDAIIQKNSCLLLVDTDINLAQLSMIRTGMLLLAIIDEKLPWEPYTYDRTPTLHHDPQAG